MEQNDSPVLTPETAKTPTPEFRATLFANDRWLPDPLLKLAETLSPLDVIVRERLQHECKRTLHDLSIKEPPVDPDDLRKHTTELAISTQLYFVYDILERRDSYQKVVAQRGY